MIPQETIPPTQAEKDRIRETWTSVFIINHKRKQHLIPECKRLKGIKPRKKPIENYPGEHLELCEFCVQDWRTWHSNFYGFEIERSEPLADGGKSPIEGSEEAAQEFLESVGWRND